ncbi:hypothetical protein GCM10010236_46500 [Streptomyces eurythermus]|nr:hypothetical protein GCM10010236_46500 [Streptomyces eurythermus]
MLTHGQVAGVPWTAVLAWAVRADMRGSAGASALVAVSAVTVASGKGWLSGRGYWDRSRGGTLAAATKGPRGKRAPYGELWGNG